MTAKHIGASEFQAECLKLVVAIERTGQSITITKRGTPVAVLGPVPISAKFKGLFGALKGSVLRYDKPFDPATEPDEWSAGQ